MIRLAPALTLVLLIGPVAAGLIGTLLPAFGYLPAIGGRDLSLRAWTDLASTPGLARSIAVSLWVGWGTTAFSLFAVALITAAAQGTRAFAFARRALSPLLAIPHVALAIGLAFTIAPSGLLFRLGAPLVGGLDRPPDLLIVHDSLGLSLMGGLILKEIPFLFLMTLAALPQAQAERGMVVARTLGYGRIAGWFKVVFPRVYPQIRLPVLAVLAYGISVVDVAIVLGPTTPPTLPVQILDWINDPDLSFRFRASAAAVLQLALVAGSIALWLAVERLLAPAGRAWIESGIRSAGERTAVVAAACLGALLVGVVLVAFAAVALWSVAEIWRFPSILPAAFSFDNWREQGPRALALTGNSLAIAAMSALIALVLVVACLENEVRKGQRAGSRTLWLLYVPLLVPQVTFLLGLQVLLISTRLDETLFAAVLVHLTFVLPYVFLSLSDPWRAWDDRYRHVGLSLGASASRVLLAIRLPMLLRALMTAAAIGVAISIGQYLATVLVAGARWPTITTEAVTVSSGGDRRVLGVYALLQAVLPLLAFTLAVAVPGMVFRNRRGMKVA